MALTVQLAPQSKGEASTIGPWQEFPTGISGGIRLCWNSEFVSLVLSAIPQGTAPHRSDTYGWGGSAPSGNDWFEGITCEFTVGAAGADFGSDPWFTTRTGCCVGG